MLQKYCPFYNANEEWTIQACLDEVGRGSWAGRVYTAAVIWNPEFEHPLLEKIKDSKKLSPKTRETLYDFIIENAIDYSIQYKDAHEIDQENILKSTMKCMVSSLDALKVNFDNIIVDGNYFCGYKDVPHKCIVKGDNTYIGIACASILAKVAHDKHMKEISIEFPQYDWHNNMGYCSPKHIKALKEYGVTKYHRMSFQPMKNIV